MQLPDDGPASNATGGDRMSLESRAHVWDLGRAQEFTAQVVDLELESGATAQVAQLPASDGFLIRIWAPGELMSQGGDNATALELVFTFNGEDGPSIEQLTTAKKVS